MSKVVVLQDKNGETVYPVGIGFSLQAITDLFYPVGSYYETSDASFDPNVSWYGTWVKDTTGQVTVGSGTNYTSGATGGSTTHKIASSELPTHTHTYDKTNGTSGVASGNTGSTTLTSNQLPSLSGQFSIADNVARNGNFSGVSEASGIVSLSAKSHNKVSLHSGTHDVVSGSVDDIVKISFGGGQGHTHSLNNHTHTVSSTSTNSGNGGFTNTAMSIMQPYIVVNRWHRTA